MTTSQTPESPGTPYRDSFLEYGGTGPENYEKFFVPAIGAPLAGDLVQPAALRPGERVLDVACGTGVLTRLAAERVGPTGAVAGLDVNPGMLAVARSVTPADARVEWHQANAERMPLPDAAFDVVLCQMGLQFVPDRRAALGEMRRVLVSGGRVILSVPGPTPEPLAILEEAIAREVSPRAGAFVGMVFSLHDTDELARLLADAGFRDVAVHATPRELRVPPPREFLWQYVRSTPLAEPLSSAGEHARARIERDVVARWQPFVEGGGMTLRVRMVVAAATR